MKCRFCGRTDDLTMDYTVGALPLYQCRAWCVRERSDADHG